MCEVKHIEYQYFGEPEFCNFNSVTRVTVAINYSYS
jgi:hypothetical protein